MPVATPDDVNLILRLYELRREPRMREARDWFVRNFRGIRTLEEFDKLCPFGSDQNASYRMVVTYWEMAASFITAGVLNSDLFFESGRELLLVWVRIEPLVPHLRERVKDPASLHNLEQVATEFAAWLDARTPGSFEHWRGMVAG